MAVTFSKAQQRSFQTAGQRAAHLRGRGFLAFEVDSVVGRLTKKQAADADLRRSVGRVVALAALYLAHVRRRILRGRTATPAQPYEYSAPRGRRGPRKYLVSALYANRANKQVASQSSAAFHAGQRTPGVVTGGLINSWTARGSGRNKAIIDAQGSSIGSTTTTRTTKRGKVRAGRFVRNRDKARSVFRRLRINHMQPRGPEAAAMVNAVAVGAHRDIFDALAIGEKTVPRTIKSGKRKGQTVLEKRFEVEMKAGTDHTLYDRLVARWVR